MTKLHISSISLKRYNPEQPRDPAGTPTGGQWTSDSIAPLRDRVPRPLINRAAIASMHKRWTPEQVDEYIANLRAHNETLDWSKIIYGSDLNQRNRASAERGRSMIRSVHDEVGGVKVESMGQAALDNFTGGGVGGTLGAYNARGIILGPRATAETYLHEYGHYLDYMLGAARQSHQAWSDKDEGLITILGPDVPNWSKRELFAEWYSGWIRGKGTDSELQNDSDFWRRERGKAVHAYLDAVMRQELRMR